MLSEVSQTEKQIPYDLTHRWNLKTKQSKTHTYRKQTGGCQRGRILGVNKVSVEDQQVRTSS